MDIYKLVLQLPKLRIISIIDTAITIQELAIKIRTAKNLTQAEFKMANSKMANKWI